MRYKHLIQALTGTKQIVCESIEMNEQVGAINIIAHPDKKVNAAAEFASFLVSVKKLF